MFLSPSLTSDVFLVHLCFVCLSSLRAYKLQIKGTMPSNLLLHRVTTHLSSPHCKRWFLCLSRFRFVFIPIPLIPTVIFLHLGRSLHRSVSFSLSVSSSCSVVVYVCVFLEVLSPASISDASWQSSTLHSFALLGLWSVFLNHLTRSWTFPRHGRTATHPQTSSGRKTLREERPHTTTTHKTPHYFLLQLCLRATRTTKIEAPNMTGKHEYARTLLKSNGMTAEAAASKTLQKAVRLLGTRSSKKTLNRAMGHQPSPMTDTKLRTHS